jgi:hypothetical protein
LLGLGLCLRALHLYLSYFLSPPAAALASGLLTLGLSGVFAWIAAKVAT